MLGAILILALCIIFISSAAELTFQDKSRAMGGRALGGSSWRPESQLSSQGSLGNAGEKMRLLTSPNSSVFGVGTLNGVMMQP